MLQEKVFDMVRQNAVEFLNGCPPETSLPKDMSQYVVAPALGENPDESVQCVWEWMHT